MYRRSVPCFRSSTIPKKVNAFPPRAEQRMIILPRWKYAKTKFVAPPPPGVKAIKNTHKQYYGEGMEPEEFESDFEGTRSPNKFDHLDNDKWRDRYWTDGNRPHLSDINPLEQDWDREHSRLVMEQPQHVDAMTRLNNKPKIDRTKVNLFDDSRVIITPGEPTMMFDLGDDAAAEDTKNVKMEMEEFRKQLKPQNWKKFMILMDRKVNDDMKAFDEWAKDKTLQEIYVGLMKEDKKKRRKGMIRRIRWYIVCVIGTYSATCGYGWHFFELY